MTDKAEPPLEAAHVWKIPQSLTTNQNVKMAKTLMFSSKNSSEATSILHNGYNFLYSQKLGF